MFADFLRYLHKCVREYIEQTHANGKDLWRGLETRTEFVLSHPNGWEGGQQGLMRKAAIMAGLIPGTPSGRSRLTFVTEGEASLHFCIQSGLITKAVEVFLSSPFILTFYSWRTQAGKGVLIVDAGGGTIDISAYKKSSLDSNTLYEEIARPQCPNNSFFFLQIPHFLIFL